MLLAELRGCCTGVRPKFAAPLGDDGLDCHRGKGGHGVQMERKTLRMYCSDYRTADT